MTTPSENTVVYKEPEHKEVVDELDAELEALLKTDPSKGLSDAEVSERLAKFGKNGKDRVRCLICRIA